MAITVRCPTCGASYSLKDEFAGKKVRCQGCESVIVVPAQPDPVIGVEKVVRGYDPAFDRDRFFMNQKKLSINEKYYVYDEMKQPILFMERPAHLGRSCLAVLAAVAVLLGGIGLSIFIASVIERSGGPEVAVGVVAGLGILASIVGTLVVGITLSPKRHITIYDSEAKERALLRVEQDAKFQPIRATYTVMEPDGTFLGKFSKNILYDLFRKQWRLLDEAGNTRLLAKEDSIILSLLRRLLGPFFGILRTNFIIVEPGTDRVLGEFNRKFALFDKYVLDMTSDPGHQVDRRLAVALGVLLDTGERR